MFHFLRLVFAAPTESEEEFRFRMERLRQEMDDLGRKQPEEVVGGSMEPIYYALRMHQALVAGDEGEARHFVSELLRVSPTTASHRMMAATFFARVGEETEAIAQLGIALALEPDNFAVHTRLAHHLVKRGEVQAAKSILEKGWPHYRKLLAKRDQESERVEYFALLERKQAA